MKRQMKRGMLSAMLALMLVLSGGTVAFGADVPGDVKGGPYEEAVYALMEEGIVSGYSDGSFRPLEPVNRAEACTMIVKCSVVTGADITTAKQSNFSDMASPEYSWALNYVNFAVEEGIVKGYADKTLRPGESVTYEEMAAMLINAMGYELDELTGSWPANYVNKAKELELFADIDSAKIGEFPANRGDVAIMIYNAASTDAGNTPKKVVIGKLNDTMSSAFFDFTIKSARSVNELNGHKPSVEGNKLVVAEVTVKNTLEEEIPVGNYDFTIDWGTGDDGVENNAREVFTEEMYPDDTTLAQGKSLSGKLVFEVPADKTNVKIIYTEIYEDDYEGDSYAVEVTVQ